MAGLPADPPAGLPAELGDALRRLARQECLADNRLCPCLPLAATEELARAYGLAPAAVDRAALELGIRPERYLRNFETYTLAEQARLLDSRAVLVGLGGLGGHALEILVRAGVGEITGVDGDEFAPSNLNRQLLCDARSLGRSKAGAADIRAALTNPTVRFTPVPDFLDEAGMDELLAGDGLLAGGAGVCLDALGGLKDRPALGRAAARAGVPLVTAAVAGQSGYVATVLPGQANAADFFGDPAQAAENTLGTPAPAVATAAAILGAEALAILCGRTPRLAGSMLLFDLGRMHFETVRL